MEMYNPPSPGEIITEIFLLPQEISTQRCAELLGISSSTLQSLLNGSTKIDADMAKRLSSTLGRSAESWLAMQANYDRWLARLAAQDCPS